MSNRFRAWKEKRKLRRGLQSASTYKLQAGQITPEKHQEIFNFSNDSEKLDRLHKQLTLDESALGAVNWSGLFDWIRENWPTILRLMFSLVILLENEDE